MHKVRQASCQLHFKVRLIIVSKKALALYFYSISLFLQTIKMQRYLLILEYDGQGYSGWQRQKDRPSVQQSLEEAIAQLDPKASPVQCAGRTDAGVHAYAMAAHVDFERSFNSNRIKEALNHFLRNKDIAVLGVIPKAQDFNARFSCLGRSYVYRILCRRAPLTFERGRVWHVPFSLDLQAMQQAATFLVGKHDFSAFRARDCQARSPVKTLDSFTVHQSDEGFLFQTTARSYLYNQVRNMVGTLYDVGRGYIAAQDIPAILESKERERAGLCAPSAGLYFWKAWYDEAQSPEVLGKDFFAYPAYPAFPFYKGK